MTTNEYLTLFISLLALVVSIAAAFVTYRQENRSQRTTIREQLTSVVQDLIVAQGDMTVLDAEPLESRDATYTARTASANLKLTSLARQACALNNMQTDVGFDVESIAIATALATMGDLPLAEEYFKNAIAKSPSPYYKVVNLGLYANFLYRQSRHAEGRRIYVDSLSVLDNSTDFNRWANGSTYQSWFVNEVWNERGSTDDANMCYVNARNLYQSIGDAGMRETAIHGLESARASSPPGERSTMGGGAPQVLGSADVQDPPKA